MYMLRILVLSFLCVWCSGVTDEDSDVYKTPDFCKGVKCPRYQVVEKFIGFELREYEPTNWVTTDLDWSLDDHDIDSGFMRLFKYANGTNQEGILVETGQPLMIFVPLKENKRASMSFFLPPEVNVPEPSENVFLQTFAEMSLYVRTFTSPALDIDFKKNGNILARKLVSQEKTFDDSFIGCVVYDPETIPHRNEVFFKAQ
ncbi:heme-binding protein 2-like isoform X2 [Pelobates fuscus]|uniref:heme-binding protein 2-like isoform X2 n=1 Tax=Pelobates fuscus TaxID=191477 RepID=UPI002FE45D49